MKSCIADWQLSGDTARVSRWRERGVCVCVFMCVRVCVCSCIHVCMCANVSECVCSNPSQCLQK